ncbi:MAG: hypothetical protein ACPGYK_04595 [Flavobacteriales bacterium]
MRLKQIISACKFTAVCASFSRMHRQCLSASVLLVFFSSACAQEWEHDLLFVPVEAPERHVVGQSEQRGGSLNLPFFDDFSTPSLASSPMEYLPHWRWADASARLTSTYAIAPPTFGVATLDGLDHEGYPYSFNNVDEAGWADTLTSRPINLSGYPVNSNIHLVFHYQGGGRGNHPDDGEDELIVEFKATDAITGNPVWEEVWSTDSSQVDVFDRVFVPVDTSIYLTSNFQFRFRNYGALSGNVDLWHLDYVLLNDGINPETFDVLTEVSYIEPENSLLSGFTRMPWTHFQTNPPGFMRDSTTTLQRNFSNTQGANIATGFVVEYVGGSSIVEQDNFFQNTNVLPSSTFTTGHYVGNNPEGSDFVFDPAASDTAAIFNVSFWETSVGIFQEQKVGVPDNDSIVFQQVFLNDYAYDDGTAEKAYALTSAGAKLALRFPVAEADTLMGLAIHFTPYYTNADDETFLLRAWSDDAGVPGEELGENYVLHTPQYFTDGYDVFSFYPFDDPIPVEAGPLHVGLIQSSEVMLNLGLDKNTNSNLGALHYLLGLGGSWTSSAIEGSVMIRPVFRAGMAGVWLSTERPAPAAETGQAALLSVYPNPHASGELNVRWPDVGAWTLCDGQGRVCARGHTQGVGWQVIDLASISSTGIYLLRHEPSGHWARIMLQR